MKLKKMFMTLSLPFVLGLHMSCVHSENQAYQGSSHEKSSTMNSLDELLDQYTVQSKQLVSDAKVEFSHERIASQSNELIKLSEAIIEKFVQKQPDCKVYLGTVVERRNQILNMNLEKIESDYHQDGALPKAPEVCYHAKDLIIHPITTKVMASKKHQDQDQMIYEIVETLGHVNVIKNML